MATTASPARRSGSPSEREYKDTGRPSSPFSAMIEMAGSGDARARQTLLDLPRTSRNAAAHDALAFGEKKVAVILLTSK